MGLELFVSQNLTDTNYDLSTSFSGLTTSARKALGILVTHRDLLERFSTTTAEFSVWQDLEELCGPLSWQERQVLTTLYQVFLGPDSSIALFENTDCVSPVIQCWVDCQNPH